MNIAENLYEEASKLIGEVSSYCNEHNIKVYTPEIDFIIIKLEYLRNGKENFDIELDRIVEDAKNMHLKPLISDTSNFKTEITTNN